MYHRNCTETQKKKDLKKQGEKDNLSQILEWNHHRICSEDFRRFFWKLSESLILCESLAMMTLWISQRL